MGVITFGMSRGATISEMGRGVLGQQVVSCFVLLCCSITFDELLCLLRTGCAIDDL